MFRREDDLKPYRDFNRVLKEFFRTLQTEFPYVPDVKKPLIYYKILKTFNKRQPQKRFQQMVAPHYMHILQRNETFFLTSFYDEGVDDIMDSVRETWRTMKNEQKEIIWEYILKLLQLSAACEQHKMESRKRLF